MIDVSGDTSEFVCDNLHNHRTEHLQYKYPDADTLLLLCDRDGLNASAHYIVKQDLVKLAKSLNINILVSKYLTIINYCNILEILSSEYPAAVVMPFPPIPVEIKILSSILCSKIPPFAD